MDPTGEYWPIYGAPVLIASDRTLRAKAVDAAGNTSAVVTQTYTVHAPGKLEADIVSPADGLVTSDETPLLEYVVRDADGNVVSEPEAEVSVLLDWGADATRSGEALGPLSEGAHTLAVRVRNEVGASTSSVQFVVDASGALVAHDQDDAALRFQGPWQRMSDPSYFEGAEAVLDGEGAILAGFSGTTVTLHGSKGPAMGKARVTIDDVDLLVDLYAPTERPDQLLYACTLPAGDHALKMEWTGEKRAESSGTAVAIDSLRLTGTLGVAPNPLTVTATADSTAATSALISAETGGSLEAVGSDGTRYRLDLPAGAFFADTEVSMRPVAALGGSPLSGGLIGGVALEPSGLRLLGRGTLTVIPPRFPER